MRFTESAAIVRGLDYYTLTVFEVTSETARRSERACWAAAATTASWPSSAARRPPPSGSPSARTVSLERMTADARRPRTVFCVVPDSREELAYALGVAGEIRTALPEAVVESDLTGRGLVKGLARAVARSDGARAVRLRRGRRARRSPGLPRTGGRQP